jgi:hypothetical protein
MSLARLLDAIERYPSDLAAARTNADALLRKQPLWFEIEEKRENHA